MCILDTRSMFGIYAVYEILALLVLGSFVPIATRTIFFNKYENRPKNRMELLLSYIVCSYSLKIRQLNVTDRASR